MTRRAETDGENDLRSVVLAQHKCAGHLNTRSAIPGMVGKMIAAHAVLGLEMTNHWFDGGAPPQFAFDLRREPALLA